MQRFFDPSGQRYGLPTFPWGIAWIIDGDLATRKQLAAMGLRPAGQEPAAQLMWRSRRATNGHARTALLYRVSLAQPKRAPSPAVLASLQRALRARRTCPTCGLVFVYCMPTSLGECPNCAYGLTPEAWELEVAV